MSEQQDQSEQVDLVEFAAGLRAQRNAGRAALEAKLDEERATMNADEILTSVAEERQAGWDRWHAARQAWDDLKADLHRQQIFSAPRATRPLIRRSRGATRQRRTAVTRSRSRSPGGESSDSSDSGSSDPPDVARRRAGTSSFPSGTPP